MMNIRAFVKVSNIVDKKITGIYLYRVYIFIQSNVKNT